jgi:hypothetical protein
MGGHLIQYSMPLPEGVSRKQTSAPGFFLLAFYIHA